MESSGDACVLPISSAAASYVPLPEADSDRATTRRSLRADFAVFSGLLLLAVLGALIASYDGPGTAGSDVTSGVNVEPSGIQTAAPMSRGRAAGVSEKSTEWRWMPLRPGEGNGVGLGSGAPPPEFAWTNSMLSWQRTAFHFQPEKNWMNDPNGPVFYNGWYHFFYQYNPNGAVWGDIVWGHAVSRDLIHWLHLPLAMVADQWYDANGVWTGSATILPDGRLVMLYTGSTNESVQVQNLAYPEDPSDPLLLKWKKYEGNPVLVPPPGILPKDFRDPTTAWLTSEGKWRIAIGSKINNTGISLIYDTTDFITYEKLDTLFHPVKGTGMWECIDVFPVSKIDGNGLDASVNGPDVKHVVKVSLDDTRKDHYAIGTYIEGNATWVPDDPAMDIGIGLRYDYGIFYASKTFYDQYKGRRILWGWIGESDSEATDVTKGWSSVQAIPRTIAFDRKTGKNVLQWPVQEVESLRLTNKEFKNVEMKPGSVVPVDVGPAAQLDIVAEFELNEAALDPAAALPDDGFMCETSGGSTQRGALGPFGFAVLAEESLAELTPVYFYVAKGPDGRLKTNFCIDQTRSSQATDVVKTVYGDVVPVLDGEKLSMRILVDHSIVEGFAQGGRTCITSRVYPTKAIYGAAKLFLFNNATEATVTVSFRAWQMGSAFIRPYPLEPKGSSAPGPPAAGKLLAVIFVILCMIHWGKLGNSS